MALCRDTEDATITAIAGDLGIHEATLAAWCRAAGVPIWHRRSAATTAASTDGSAEIPERELARLRAENQQLRADKSTFATERKILRNAAKYFAGEMNW